MSTATQYLNDGTLAANRAASGYSGMDPRRRRFALNPGIYLCEVAAGKTGRTSNEIPPGLVTFRSVPLAGDDFTHAEKNGRNPDSRPQRTVEDTPAASFLANYLKEYSEMGAREIPALTAMEDPIPNEHGNVTKAIHQQSAQGYFEALWPSFAEIGHECPEGLKECVTCRLWLLGDPADGIPAQPAVSERIERLTDQDRAYEAHGQVVDCLKSYYAWLTMKWASLVGEIMDRRGGKQGIAKLGTGEQHVRRNLHEIEPSEAATAREYGNEVAAGQAEGFKDLAAAMRESKGGDNSDLMRMMIERQNKTDDALESLAKSVKTLVDKQSGS